MRRENLDLRRLSTIRHAITRARFFDEITTEFKYDGKADVEKEILVRYFLGDFHGGRNKYDLAISDLKKNRNEYLREYDAFKKEVDILWKEISETSDEERRQELRKKRILIEKEALKILPNLLYKIFKAEETK